MRYAYFNKPSHFTDLREGHKHDHFVWRRKLAGRLCFYSGGLDEVNISMDLASDPASYIAHQYASSISVKPRILSIVKLFRPGIISISESAIDGLFGVDPGRGLKFIIQIAAGWRSNLNSEYCNACTV